jgi:phosphoenolpyruvate synthase/pyruvate phosphate dikinase
MTSRLLRLDGPLPLDHTIVGGKAVGLARLCALGANVPDGVVVPAGVRWSSALEGDIRDAVDSLAPAGEPMPRLAVRSSATVEDSLGASYAGMYKTVLGVAPDDVPAAVDACRRSAYSARLRAYRNALTRASDEGARVAVIVQRMLQPDYAGVCFTADPVSCDPSKLVIEATRGLGDRLAGGAVIPDYYRLRLANGDLLHFVPGDDAPTAAPVLPDVLLRVLWREAKRIGEALRWPVDLEFAFAAGRLYLLQARPVTTLTGSPQDPAPTREGVVSWRRNTQRRGP